MRHVSVHSRTKDFTTKVTKDTKVERLIFTFVLFVSFVVKTFFQPWLRPLSAGDSRAVEFDRVVPEDFSFGFT